MTWRDTWRPASYKGVGFRVDASQKAGGRRGQAYEYPKSDEIDGEDLGRRAKRWTISGYIVGPNYTSEADSLEAVLDSKSPGLLIHHTMGELTVRCDHYTRGERREQGGMATFEMVFVEWSSRSNNYTQNTQAAVNEAAYAAQVETISAANNDPSIKAGPR